MNALFTSLIIIAGIAFAFTSPLWYTLLIEQRLLDRRWLPRVRKEMLPIIAEMRKIIAMPNAHASFRRDVLNDEVHWRVRVSDASSSYTMDFDEENGRFNVALSSDRGSTTFYKAFPRHQIDSIKLEPWLRESIDALVKEAEAKDAEIRKQHAALLKRAEATTPDPTNTPSP